MKKSFLLGIILGLMIVSPALADNNDEATLFYNKGIDLYEQDKVEQSIESFKKAISLKPEFYEAYYNLARIQEALNKFQDAFNSYEALLKINPNDYESTLQYGELLYKRGYLSKSVTYLNRIPSESEYKARADELLVKIAKRQKELAIESEQKAKQALKTRTLQSVPAPSGVAIDSNGNMYVASFSNNEIYKINKDGKSVYADEKKGVGGPIGLAIDSNNNIYVANYNKGNILLIKPNGETSVLLTAKQPYCIIVDEAKNKIYVTEQQTNSILSHDISDILIKKANENPVPAVNKEPEKKVFTYPVKDKNPLGVPSIQEAPYTKGDARSSITAPIMVPSEGLFD